MGKGQVERRAGDERGMGGDGKRREEMEGVEIARRGGNLRGMGGDGKRWRRVKMGMEEGRDWKGMGRGGDW